MSETVIVKSCVDGEITTLQQVKDPVFAQRIAGDGVAITPSSTQFVAPISGELKMLFNGLHAFVIETQEGLYILVHIGTNTLALGGKGFMAHKHQGDMVNAGDLIISVDSEMMKDPSIDYTTVVLMMNNRPFRSIDKAPLGDCVAGETTILSITT
ncbi:MAG: PTS glucose transporter subunit IIA [Erysipelothrix sp.]|nr:PTS glucose transporter subunit IIA [Erysipelothrix sp.]